MIDGMQDRLGRISGIGRIGMISRMDRIGFIAFLCVLTP